MSDKQCSNCNQLFRDGDEIKALIISRYKGLKSEVHYAIEKPTQCLEISHANCQFPQGNSDEN